MFFSDRRIEDKFASYPTETRTALLELRQLILETGSRLTLFGEVEESLKWNQPSYAILGKKIGTAIRIDQFDAQRIALYVSSNTPLLQEYRKRFGSQFEYDKNRALILDVKKELPKQALEFCINMAFTYHLNKDLL